MTLRRFRQTSKVYCFNCKKTDKNLATSLTTVVTTSCLATSPPNMGCQRKEQQGATKESNIDILGSRQRVHNPIRAHSVEMLYITCQSLYIRTAQHISHVRTHSYQTQTDRHTQRLVDTSTCTSFTYARSCTHMIPHPRKSTSD